MPIYLCTCPGCSGNSAFPQDNRGCSFQVFWTLHHADAPGFLRTFTRTLGVVFFGFLYILQMLWKFRIFLGHLPRHRGCYFWVFHTLHHANVPIFLETFTWTWGFFFSGFPHTTSCRCSDFSQDIYTDTGVVFFGFSAQLKLLISLFPGLPLTHTKIYQDSAHL